MKVSALGRIHPGRRNPRGFLIANREPVALSLDPFSVENPAIATPPIFLWVWLMLALLIGVGVGAAGMWMSGRELRIRAKADRLELKALKKSGAAKAAAQPVDSTPAIDPPAT
ncbi:MAG: hypothetical protein R3C42_06615 [Parvularculaceae bacterium]